MLLILKEKLLQKNFRGFTNYRGQSDYLCPSRRLCD